MHEVLVNRLGDLSLPRKSVVRLTDRPDMTLGVYRGRKTTTQQQHHRLTRPSPSAVERNALAFCYVHINSTKLRNCRLKSISNLKKKYTLSAHQMRRIIHSTGDKNMWCQQNDTIQSMKELKRNRTTEEKSYVSTKIYVKNDRKSFTMTRQKIGQVHSLHSK